MKNNIDYDKYKRSTTLKDGFRKVVGVKKQILKVKGKLWILGLYVTPGRNKKKILKLSDAGSDILNRNIRFKNAVFNSITKGIKLCVVENGANSSTKLLKVLDWGIQYGSRGNNKFNPVTVKRFKRGNKYYSGVWVKGVRGIQSVEKYNYTNQNKVERIIDNIGTLSSDTNNNIYSNEY